VNAGSVPAPTSAPTAPRPPAGPAAIARAAEVGARVRCTLDGPVPAFAVLTGQSLLRGRHSPAVWGAALRALHDGAAGDGAWAVCADVSDVAALPGALEHWGAGRVAVGVHLFLPRCAYGDEDDADASRALVVARDAAAYARLCRLCSWRCEHPARWASFLRGAPCATPWDDLVVLVDDAAWIRRLRALGARAHWRAHDRPARVPGDLARDGVRAVAVPSLAWLEDADRSLAPVLAAIRTGTTVAATAGAADGFASLAELAALPRRFAGFESQLRRGRALLAACTAFRDHDGDRPRWHVPPAPVVDADADDELRRLAEAGIPARYGDGEIPAVRARLEHELAVIRDTRFAGYVLTVHDLARGRTTCGRGSGAGSLVCYLLGITNVDPIRYRLLFERFLTRERRDPPDIDVDFPWDERDEVIAAALSRYGRDRAAMVATHQQLTAKAALREVARAHGFDDGAISSMRDRLRDRRRFGLAFDDEAPWPEIRAAAAALDGQPHHYGLHPGGVVITGAPIRELTVVHPAAKTIAGAAVPTIAWEKDGAEAMGLVKIDLLGNRSLAVIRDCVDDLRADGVRIPRDAWLHPDEDPATRALVARGATMGCFYIESPATRQLQAKAGSGDFDRLVVHSSIIRPAAMRWIDTYLARLHEHRRSGRMRAEWFPHPALAGLLSESYGVLSYQEDVMVVCRELAGFSDPEANRVRKVLGSWGAGEVDRLAPLRARFFAGCRDRGVARAVADEVWAMVESFTGYSFCKAHSASYAMVSFQCAYLKAHHPAHFLARVIANGGGFYAPAAYAEEARRLGVAIRAPCVQRGGAATRAEGPGAIRCGLQLVEGLGEGGIAAILAARRERPFAGLGDLRHRARLDVEQLRALLDAGALDALLPDLDDARRAWLVAAVARRTRRAAAAGAGAQTSLALLPGPGPGADPVPPPLPPVDPRERAWRQYRALGGILPAHHPLLLHDPPRRRVRARDVSAARAGETVSVIGIEITSKQVAATIRRDRRGRELPAPREEPMGFVTLEDETGLVETVWFPEVYRRYGPLLAGARPLRVTGMIAAPFGCPNLEVRRVEEM